MEEIHQSFRVKMRQISLGIVFRTLQLTGQNMECKIFAIERGAVCDLWLKQGLTGSGCSSWYMEQPGDTLYRDFAACRKSTSLSFTYTSFRQPAPQVVCKGNKTVLGIRIRMFLGLPDPDPLVRVTDPDPAPDPSLFS
jgi:hypothetical protein